ncbi:Tim17/Tim22/Tim23/Pmp24 domain-containing protein [Streptomyces ureilyticus]|uniref:Uncharacterized protein n=1 Tax=Streptomyces ureilyticus TaxID=1775131 RepID=A0ABX0E257_9ACTN|nr:hypothetical protein [Streptomyces ureilyticus]NGO48280.1 hypothetical protein [Streptomyces ureilyticus]
MAGVTHADELLNLTVLCLPPSNLGPSRRERPERTVRRIPGNHDDLIAAYGTGCFDEFLWIFANGAKNANLDISENTRTMQSILRGKEVPVLCEALSRHHASPEELIQWGITDNGDSMLWLPVGDAESWPTVVIQAGQLDFVISEKSSTGVVLGLLAGALRISFFPDDFPSDHPEFSSDPCA